MALEGNLGSFGLEEILQLIAVQQKTGMLSVTAPDKSTVLYFRDGKIISTRDRRSRTRDPFRDYLTRYGVLGREELVRITQMTSQSKLDLLDVLASEKLIDEQQLPRHWRNHIQETLHDVITWDQCSYKFVAGEEVIAGVKSIGEHMVEPLLMECMRRIDEFPMLLEAFPAQGVKIAAIGREPGPEVEMMTSERDVLAIVKQARSVRDVIARAKIPAFDTYEALKLLKEKNLIVVEQDAQFVHDTEAAATTRKRRRQRGNPLTFVAASFVFAACLLVGVYRHSDTAMAIVDDGLVASDSAARARIEYRVRWLVEAYRAENGVYPASLDDLKSSGLASRELLSRAAEQDLRYKLTRDGSAFTLL
jgi:Domain of unknown function (DUF4388)